MRKHHRHRPQRQLRLGGTTHRRNPPTANARPSEWLTATIQERDPDVIEGHNIFKTDLPALARPGQKLKVRLGWGRDGSPIKSRSSRLQIAEKAIQYPKVTIRGRHVVDTWILAQYYDISSRELESFERKTVAAHFGLAEPSFDVAPPPPAKSATPHRHLEPQLLHPGPDFPYNYQDVIIRGNATKIDALFLREYLRRGHSIRRSPEARAFEGGYTAIFETGVINEVWHCDVASLYPSVMLAFGFTPENDVLGTYRGMLQDLRTFRLEAKAELRSAANPIERGQLDALQNTFKILINSFYGYLGFGQGHFADFAAAENVTAKGARSCARWSTGSANKAPASSRSTPTVFISTRPAAQKWTCFSLASPPNCPRASRWNSTSATAPCSATRRKTTPC